MDSTSIQSSESDDKPPNIPSVNLSPIVQTLNPGSKGIQSFPNLNGVNPEMYKVLPQFMIDDDLNSYGTMAEYIWIDGSGQKTRSKTKIYRKQIRTLEDVEWWAADGSSTRQATSADSEIFLKPVQVFPDPFRGKPHVLVLCETYLSDMITPARYNFRALAQKIFNECQDQKPWFGIEQEYYMFTSAGARTMWPIGWPINGEPQQLDQFSCSAGNDNTFGRAMAEAHLRCCMKAGLKIHGMNSEYSPSQWEYQIGIAEGIECADHVWVARYLLERVGEYFGVNVSFKPKPVKGQWSSSGGHCNYSTQDTRGDGGLKVIKEQYLPILDRNHKRFMKMYGEGNEERLSSKQCNNSYEEFVWGERSRLVSVRIPVLTERNGKGYLEDRRPAANSDPYLVTSILFNLTCQGNKFGKEIEETYEKSIVDIIEYIY